MLIPVGLKIAVCQMDVIPAKPLINARYMAQDIKEAGERGVHIIVFPELAVPGYLIGDKFEYDDFVRQIELANRSVAEATQNGVVAIFGSVKVDWTKKGEDGRPRKFNAAFVAEGGKITTTRVKALQPNYRFFNDDRHFFSLRKLAEEVALQEGSNLSDVYNRLVRPVHVRTPLGLVDIGLHECEDMWDGDYNLKPTQILYDGKIMFFVNLSASPWGWQKNRKRHQVVRDILAKCPVPYIYVNKVGVDQIGKSIVVYDGASTVYSSAGEIVLETAPYKPRTTDILIGESVSVFVPKPQDDTAELYRAVSYAMQRLLPETTVIGLSGGIDSAVTTAIAAAVMGPDKVLAINMPHEYNSQESQDEARYIARNLGVKYIVQPIAAMADPYLSIQGVEKGSIAFENVLARCRGNILSTYAQLHRGIFLCNGNKVEYLTNYGTLYGDIAGGFAFLADLTKQEVRQLADYINRVVYKREVIPQQVIDKPPSAELKPGQVDPFDYGTLTRKGYHDELVRAFTDFRKTPEWVLEALLNGTLEREMKLEPGTIARFFPDNKGKIDVVKFIADLEQRWTDLQRNFKRNQAPFILVVSRKAFGSDNVESMFAMEITARYFELKRQVLSLP